MNSFGRLFRISIYGESHGPEIGVLIDGCPAGIPVSESDFIQDLSRRMVGQIGTSSRVEDDKPIIKSGFYNGFTTGSPILIAFQNKNINSADYDFDGFFRPGHADFTAYKKFRGYNDPNGGGHFSGRLTLALVAAGTVAKKLLPEIRISASLISAGGDVDISNAINNAVILNDSVGGLVECRVNNLPVGLGEPFFDSIESLISHAVFAIPGVKAIEFGEGIKSASAKGSEFNDAFANGRGQTLTNNSGGINGGITNGNELFFRVFFKPTSSIGKSQQTYNFNTNQIAELEIKGRHDACFALRTPVVIEAVAAIVLADFKLISGI